jgi:hypothetical protein
MNYLEVTKLRFNSGGSVSHCKGISSLINAPQKRRIFDLRRDVLELDGWL